MQVVALAPGAEGFELGGEEQRRVDDADLLAAGQAFIRKSRIAPPVFAELLQQYKTVLPPDATIRDDLIRQGFLPGPAESCAAVFRRSVKFAAYFGAGGLSEAGDDRPRAVTPGDESHPGMAQRQPVSAQASLTMSAPPGVSASPPASGASSLPSGLPVLPAMPAGDSDCLPVRLTGGRRAWLVIPQQFFEADKARLRAQIDLLLTVEQEQAMG